ncbi:ribosomal protein L18ae [Coniophora puteana RWD-64-598 SS2]|uniref:Ribosomal protein L18ae n=1 Tax=Coniophora puteana (strain RWD-64-598) TaxID=741705 RepID=A0A5M3M6B0_CONPW|nr:ribosomal protein L18ae [Coniophora puteana RWD-64-598 SS2]EIW74889.1 ribosomal protein L18ae [Coniophora puteana RWD-64-598 SS2]
MRIFALEKLLPSHFWCFLRQLKKVKKASSEIVGTHEKRLLTVKNFDIWPHYDSRSGTHIMYKEFRELSRADAVKSHYQDMAARYHAHFRSIHSRPHRVVKSKPKFVAQCPTTF